MECLVWLDFSAFFLATSLLSPFVFGKGDGTLTFTYADDVVIPEIPDAEGIHVVERTNNQLVIEHTRDDDEVYDYIKSCGLTSRPIKLSIEFFAYEDPEEEENF